MVDLPSTWWLIPLSKWVTTLVINGISRLKWDEAPSMTCAFSIPLPSCEASWNGLEMRPAQVSRDQFIAPFFFGGLIFNGDVSKPRFFYVWGHEDP